MIYKHETRWNSELEKYKGKLKTPFDLLHRAASSETFLDTAVVGGVSVADIIAGRIEEDRIPHSVINAFHLQFPQYGASFTSAVREHSADPKELMGLVNGVKGKLFETEYVDWLNHEHLPQGYSATLAHSATNPGWDISIQNAHGHIDKVLQMKATDSLNYVKHALDANPQIDVVVPHDVYTQIDDHGDLAGHVIDSPQTLQDLDHTVAIGVDHANSIADVGLHIPFVAIAFASVQNYRRYRTGNISFNDALRNTGERSVLAVITGVVTKFSIAAFHEPFIGLPVAICTRVFLGWLMKMQKQGKILDMQIQIIDESYRCLERNLQYRLLPA